MDKIMLDENYNIYFLDTCLHKNLVGGLEVANKIREVDEKGLLIFVSSHSELAFKSYKYLVSAYTFIDKNEGPDNFKQEIHRCLDRYFENKRCKENTEIITINTKCNTFRIKLSEIYYFESVGMHRIALKENRFYKEFYSS